jgi:phosphoglycolate phosphatase
LALAGSGIAPGRAVWFAGDADIDMECAANSGCIPVLIREEAPKNEEFPNFPPEWHFGACLALCKHLQNM